MSDKKWNPPKKVDLKREGAWQLTTYMQFMRENLKKKKKTSLDVNVHQRILEVCCVNYASLGIKYL